MFETLKFSKPSSNKADYSLTVINPVCLLCTGLMQEYNPVVTLPDPCACLISALHEQSLIWGRQFPPWPGSHL